MSLTHKSAATRLRDAIVMVVGMAWALAGIVCESSAAQKTFSSPEAAVKQLVDSARAKDTKGLISLLGPGASKIVSSGDKVQDRATMERFVSAYDAANKIETSGDSKAILSIGKDNWPLPIPIVKTSAGWHFDAQQGAEEILNRRIGRNELSVIQVVQAYVDAQREYYLTNPQKSKLLQYAQRFRSSPGKRDGLYYPAKSGEPPSPLGPLFERAKSQGYVASDDSQPGSYFGYHYRILTSQGANAKGGAYSYMAKGAMMGGFGVVAWPTTYGNSGIMTFVINQDGNLYQKDLGPRTTSAVQKITSFNPDNTWTQVPDAK